MPEFSGFLGSGSPYTQFILPVRPDQRGLLSFRTNPGVELSDIRYREITAISNATLISFAADLGVDQQAVFPGGTEEMFNRIKQNIKYPKGDKVYLARRDVGVEFEVNA